MRPSEMRLDTSVVATCVLLGQIYLRAQDTPTSISKGRGEVPNGLA